MSVPVPEFWKLAVASRAIAPDEAQSLLAAFSRTRGADKANSVTVAEWLIDGGILTRYQARQLLTGNPGPLVLGDYRIISQVRSGPLAELYRANHATTGQTTLLFFCDAAPPGSDWSAAQQQAEARLRSRYPLAGRVFGMVEADGRRFLVLEDNSAVVAQAPAPLTPTTTVARPTPAAPTVHRAQVVSANAPAVAQNRPVPAPRHEPVRNDDPPVVIKINSSSSTPTASPLSAYTRRRRRSNTPVLIGIGVAAIGVILAAIVVLPSSEPEGTSPTANVNSPLSEDDETPPATKPTTPIPVPPSIKPNVLPEESAPADAASVLEVADDGKSLWISPTHGPPVDLRYLANGAQLFLVLRPSSLLGNEEGERVFEALGPQAITGSKFVQQVAGFELIDIERLLVAYYPNGGQPLDVGMVVTLREPKSKDELLQAWHNPKETGKATKYYQGGSWAYYIPPSAAGRTFSVLPPRLMEEMLAQDGPPLFRKEMEKLLRDTDDTRQFTLLGYPNFLFSDGDSLLSGKLGRLKAPLLEYLGEGVQAAALSMHLASGNFFAELRVWGTLDHNGYALAQDYRDRLNAFPDRIESFLATLTPSNYGRLILTRMPRMIGQFASFTRVGEENNQAVLRCYLPAAAAHNLALATDLALSEGAGGGVVVASGPTAMPQATLADALKRKINLSFPRNTLEQCMEMLSEEIGFPVHIEGADLQLEGITKNQSFSLDERGKPAGEILRKVMLLANPDGKLVYVLKPLKPGGTDVVFVTTRAAVAKRGDKLPPELERPPEKK